jgi:hypothetical protein
VVVPYTTEHASGMLDSKTRTASLSVISTIWGSDPAVTSVSGRIATPSTSLDSVADIVGAVVVVVGGAIVGVEAGTVVGAVVAAGSGDAAGRQA